jgi:hypothetical protein
MARFPGVGEVRIDARGLTLCHFELGFADASGTYTIPVKAGTFVHDIGTFVTTAFTTSGSNASLAIGDGNSAAGYMATTDTALQTIDTVVTRASTSGEAYATGEYYSVDDTIDFVFVAASAGATAGKVKGFVVMSNVYNDGITANV